MKNLISRLTTRTKINNYQSFLNASHETCFEQVQRKAQQTRKSRLFLENVQSIQLSEHAAKRWNERVGPFMEEAQLIVILNSLLLVPGSIKFINKEEGRIEDDIVFTYFIEEDKIVITTFYGRVSLHPALNNLNLLKRFNYCEQDTYNLDVSQKILDRQRLPLIPEEIIQFNGSKSVYLIEKYVNGDQDSCLFFYKVTSDHVAVTMKIDPNRPEQPLLTRKTLYILNRLGYADFVIKHLIFHQPEAVKEIRLESLMKKVLHPINVSLRLTSLPIAPVPYVLSIRREERIGLVQAS